MGQTIKLYTTEDAINDYRFWQGQEAAAAAFEKCAPAPQPGKVIDFDNTPYYEAQMRLARFAASDFTGAILMLEAVIPDMEDEGAGTPTWGLRCLQKVFTDRLSQERARRIYFDPADPPMRTSLGHTYFS